MSCPPNQRPACALKHFCATQIDVINDLLLLTAKPVTYLVNLSERDYIRKKNKWLPKIKQWIDENAPGDLLIPVSVALEERLALEYAENPAGLKEELEKLGTQSQIGKIMKIGYQSLHVRVPGLLTSVKIGLCDGLAQLIHYFTCGPDEVRAWTIREGLPAPKAAGVIQCVSACFQRGRHRTLTPSSRAAPTLRRTLFAARS